MMFGIMMFCEISNAVGGSVLQIDKALTLPDAVAESIKRNIH